MRLDLLNLGGTIIECHSFVASVHQVIIGPDRAEPEGVVASEEGLHDVGVEVGAFGIACVAR